MNDLPPRYNAGIQRSKGLLEIAAALYDTSLSRRSTRSGTRAPQIDSRLGTNLALRIDRPRDSGADRGFEVSFAIGGSRENFLQVARKEVSLLWINPSAPLTQAYRGLPPFSEPLPLRAIAVFPSWDAVVVAVHRSTGITAIEQIRERRPALRVSTGNPTEAPFDEDPTMFAVTTMIAAAGFSLDDIRAWGGTVQSVPRPSHPDRAKLIEEGALDAIFDEGLLSWGQFALERGFQILPIEGAMRARIAAAGYDVGALPQSRLPGLERPIDAVDFSGWPMIVHADMPEELAYALCEAIEARKLAIPTDNYRPLDLAQLCSMSEETPRGAPLHPGAERYYRERGYLR